MTPKEKAEELTIKAAEHTDIHNNIGAVDHDLWDKRNRQIALIVVEEQLALLNEEIFLSGDAQDRCINYWNNVKVELNAP